TGRTTSYVNALYVLALRESAELAGWLGHPGPAAHWRTRAARVAAGVNRLLWDPAAGADVDSTTGTRAHPRDGNALAMAGGIASARQTRQILSFEGRRLATPNGLRMVDTTALDSRGPASLWWLVPVGAVLLLGGAFVRRRAGRRRTIVA